MEEFGVSSTVAILPLTLYVIALGFGPIIGGPISETWGRYPVYAATIPLGALFTLGAGLTHNYGSLCFFRFMAGFSWGSVLAAAAGSIADTYDMATRGPASIVYILMPFLGPGLGYVC
jgi:MFS family permease